MELLQLTGKTWYHWSYHSSKAGNNSQKRTERPVKNPRTKLQRTEIEKEGLGGGPKTMQVDVARAPRCPGVPRLCINNGEQNFVGECHLSQNGYGHCNMKHANSTYPVHQNPLGIQTSHSEEMLHIVAWGCTWHGCWIEGNNHKYEGRNEREKHFYINTCFNILKHHSSEECICPYISLRLLVCWLTRLVTEQHTYEWSKKNICPPLCWLPLVTPLIFPHILYSLAITITFTYF